MEMGANQMYFHLPIAIFQFVFVSRFEFLCRLIKTFSLKPVRFVSSGRHEALEEECPLKYCSTYKNVNISCENMFL